MMQAYSEPITPPPTTIKFRGRQRSDKMSSDEKTFSASNGTLVGARGPRAGRDDEALRGDAVRISSAR